jgi:hypothetical protein
MKPNVTAILCGLAAWGLVSGAVAQAPEGGPAWGVPQVYSDMSYGTESGDIGGMEVVLVPGDGEFWAVVQIAEGVPKGPVLVKAQVEGSKVEFSLPAGLPAYDGYGKFTGEISETGLKLWHGGEEYGFLKRQCER